MIPFFRKRRAPASSARGASWRRLLLPGLVLGLLLTIVPIQAAVRANHPTEATVLATVSPPPPVGEGNLGVTLSGPVIVPQGAPFTVTATLTNSGLTTIENAGVTIQPPAGITLSGYAEIYVPDIAPGGQQEATWLLTADANAITGDYIILASAHGNEVGNPSYQWIAEDTILVGIVLPTAFDDGDGIHGNVDTIPLVFSNDFSDEPPFVNGTTTGTITSRGDQILSVTDEPDPKGVLIVADPSGGAAAATVSACSGATSLSFTPGDWAVVTCGSAIIQVVQGTVEVSFFGANGELVTASLTAGNGLTFQPESVSVIAPATNQVPVAVIIHVNGFDQQISLSPGAVTELVNSVMARLVDVDVISDIINLGIDPTVALAIFGDGDFIVDDVDLATLLFDDDDDDDEHAGSFIRSWLEDEDSDGYTDLLVEFLADPNSVSLGDITVCVAGATLDGMPIGGCDIVTVIAEIIPAIPPTPVTGNQPGPGPEDSSSEDDEADEDEGGHDYDDDGDEGDDDRDEGETTAENLGEDSEDADDDVDEDGSANANATDDGDEDSTGGNNAGADDDGDEDSAGGNNANGDDDGDEDSTGGNNAGADDDGDEDSAGSNNANADDDGDEDSAGSNNANADDDGDEDSSSGNDATATDDGDEDSAGGNDATATDDGDEDSAGGNDATATDDGDEDSAGGNDATATDDGDEDSAGGNNATATDDGEEDSTGGNNPTATDDGEEDSTGGNNPTATDDGDEDITGGNDATATDDGDEDSTGGNNPTAGDENSESGSVEEGEDDQEDVGVGEEDADDG